MIVFFFQISKMKAVALGLFALLCVVSLAVGQWGNYGYGSSGGGGGYGCK